MVRVRVSDDVMQIWLRSDRTYSQYVTLIMFHYCIFMQNRGWGGGGDGGKSEFLDINTFYATTIHPLTISYIIRLVCDWVWEGGGDTWSFIANLAPS